jgi:hypothetical protein
MKTFREIALNEAEGDIKWVRLLLISKDINLTGSDKNSLSYSYTGNYTKTLKEYLIKRLDRLDIKEVKGEDTGDNEILRSADKNIEIIISDFKGNIKFKVIHK